jgi:hypothetical protein
MSITPPTKEKNGERFRKVENPFFEQTTVEAAVLDADVRGMQATRLLLQRVLVGREGGDPPSRTGLRMKPR